MHTISSVEFKRPVWQSVALMTLGFWLSASLILDWVIMPSLYISGMMTQASFASAGYVIFWNFNRVELLSAGLVLASVLALTNTKSEWRSNAIILSVLLLCVSILDTYFLTPQMSAIGLNLHMFEVNNEIPSSMNLFHAFYWILETIKLAAGGVLLNWCWRR